MKRRLSVPLSTLIALMTFSTLMLGASVLAGGQTGTSGASKWTHPKTPWGHPDLQAIWTSNGMAGVPLERPKEFGTRAELNDQEMAERVKKAEIASRDDQESRKGQVGNEQGPTHWYEWFGRASRASSLIIDPPDGQIPPFTPEGRKLKPTMGTFRPGPYDNPEDFNAWDRCITRGMPLAFIPTAYNNAYQIIQTPKDVVIHFEMLHTSRIIPVDGSPLPDGRISRWEGESRGRWEGNTLVVETTNFSELTKGTLPANGSSSEFSIFGKIFTGTGATMRLVERFSRVGPDQLRYEATVEDKVMFTRPWTMALDLARDDSYMIYEYACHEGNRAIENSLRGSRAEDREKAKAEQQKKK
jgi:hypothetical protein